MDFKSDIGQGTVEFAIVVGALLVIVLALGLFWNLGDAGILIEHAIASASHNIEEAALGIAGDVFCV